MLFFDGGLQGDRYRLRGLLSIVQRQCQAVLDAVVAVGQIGRVGIARHHGRTLDLACAQGASLQEAEAVGNRLTRRRNRKVCGVR